MSHGDKITAIPPGFYVVATSEGSPYAAIVPRSLGVQTTYPTATALVYDLSVATRNTADFAGTGVKLMNPFRAEPEFGSTVC